MDLLLTNLGNYYQVPLKHPPFRLSDHSTISLSPNHRTNVYIPEKKLIKIRDMRPNFMNALGRYLSAIDWSTIENYQSTECKRYPLDDGKAKIYVTTTPKISVPKQYYPFQSVPQLSRQRTEINQVKVLSIQNKTSQWKRTQKVVVRMQTPLRHDKNSKRFC